MFYDSFCLFRKISKKGLRLLDYKYNNIFNSSKTSREKMLKILIDPYINQIITL